MVDFAESELKQLYCVPPERGHVPADSARAAGAARTRSSGARRGASFRGFVEPQSSRWMRRRSSRARRRRWVRSSRRWARRRVRVVADAAVVVVVVARLVEEPAAEADEARRERVAGERVARRRAGRRRFDCRWIARGAAGGAGAPAWCGRDIDDQNALPPARRLTTVQARFNSLTEMLNVLRRVRRSAKDDPGVAGRPAEADGSRDQVGERRASRAGQGDQGRGHRGEDGRQELTRGSKGGHYDEVAA